MDIWLNVGFGVVGVVSLIYAVWQNRTSRSAQELTQRVTHNIQHLAREIIADSPGTPAMAYAKSIVQVSGSLLDGDRTGRRASSAVSFEIEYTAIQLRSRLSRAAVSPDAKYGVALSGKYSGRTWIRSDLASAESRSRIFAEAALIYGPYCKLPFAGVYEAEFRIRRADVDRLSSRGLVLLDVYQLSREAALATLEMSARDLLRSWQSVRVQFECVDPEAVLEYRVLIMQPDVEISLDIVTVRLQERFG